MMILKVIVCLGLFKVSHGHFLNKTSSHGAKAHGNSKWTYGELGIGLGPEHWPAMFSTCAGHQQSPVDIRTLQTVYDPALREFSVFYDPPLPTSKFYLHNNGHSVEVTTKGEFYLSDGGLTSLYKTEQFHFHWGSNNNWGSEHTFDGRPAAMEMHICSWDADHYTSFSEAAKHKGGIAALAIQFEVSPYDNPVLEPIVQVLQYIRDPESKMKISIPAFSLRDFLPDFPSRYYRYEGSLTTPECFESIIWTVFKEKQTISNRQLNVFRSLLCAEDHGNNGESPQQTPDRSHIIRNTLVNNFRPIQPLNGRTVYRSFIFQQVEEQIPTNNMFKYYLEWAEIL